MFLGFLKKPWGRKAKIMRQDWGFVCLDTFNNPIFSYYHANINQPNQPQTDKP